MVKLVLQQENGSGNSNGKSAYDIWLENGNEGTEEDFLSSLIGPKGEKGSNGLKGDRGATGDRGSDGTNGLKGDQGATITEISFVKNEAGEVVSGIAKLSDATSLEIIFSTEGAE